MALLAYSCSVIFSFLYQFSHKGILKFKYFFSRSTCDYCRQMIKPYDLLPIISYVLLKGRSRCCHKKLHKYYIIGEILAVSPVFLYSATHVNIHFTLFLLTFLFLLTMSLYDMYDLTIDLKLIFIYILVAMSSSHIFFLTFSITFIISHIFYLFLFKYIGYGDILVFNMLALFLPLNFFMYVIIFTFIIGGVSSLLIKISIDDNLKHIPLIPFIFLSFITVSVFYQNLYQIIGGAFY